MWFDEGGNIKRSASPGSLLTRSRADLEQPITLFMCAAGIALATRFFIDIPRVNAARNTDVGEKERLDRKERRRERERTDRLSVQLVDQFLSDVEAARTRTTQRRTHDERTRTFRRVGLPVGFRSVWKKKGEDRESSFVLWNGGKFVDAAFSNSKSWRCSMYAEFPIGVEKLARADQAVEPASAKLKSYAMSGSSSPPPRCHGCISRRGDHAVCPDQM